MALQNYYGKTYTVIREPTVACTADSYSDLVDLQDYKGQMAIILNTSAGSGTTSRTLAVSAYTSADSGSSSGAGYAAVTGADFTTITTTKSHQVIALDKRACSRFLRLYFNISGSGATYNVAASIVGDDGGY